MLITVGERTYGWGAEVRDLPENKTAYGPHVMEADEEAALAKKISESGWISSWRTNPSERVVFLCSTDAPTSWRQALATRGLRGQSLQVVEKPKPQEKPKA